MSLSLSRKLIDVKMPFVIHGDNLCLCLLKRTNFEGRCLFLLSIDYVFDYFIVFIGICNQIIVEEFIDICIAASLLTVDSYIFRDRVCNRIHFNTCKICIMVQNCAIDDT